MYFDPLYLLMIAPGLVLSLWASFRTRSAFNKYSKVRTARGLSGAQAAQVLLDRAGIHDVQIVPGHGFLSDHYNPVTKKLSLSEPVYASSSVAADSWTTAPSRTTRTRSARPSTSSISLETTTTATPRSASARTSW